MTFVRYVTVSVFFVLFLSIASLDAAGASGKTGLTEGTFVGIEQGDPAHFLIKEKGGGEHWFTILRHDESVQPYLDNPARFKGRPVKVYWIKRVMADGLMTVVMKGE